MTVVTARPVTAGRPTRRGSAVLLPAVVAVVAVLAFVVRLRLLTHGASIAASDGYDDGVYYAAADALVHGRLPYRDFLLLHPPGIVLALAPFAALGAVFGDPVGVAAGRIAFLGIGATNTALIALVASRHSRAAALVAGLGAALFFPLAYSERSTLLEPLGTALLLGAVVLLWQRRGAGAAVVAGVVAGLSLDVKIWYAVPVLLLSLLAARRRRFLIGAAVGAAGVALPFLAAAPVSMFREVVLDQLGRPSSAGPRVLVHRLVLIGADPKALTGSTTAAHAAHLLAPLVLGLVAVAAIGAWRVRWARVIVLNAGATGLVLLVSPSFFIHYVGYAAPWMLLVVGIGVGVLVERFRSRAVRAGLALVPVVLLAAASLPGDLRTTAAPQPAAQLHTAMAGWRGCIVSDDPGLLTNAELLSPMLRRGCPLWPDVTGWTYDRDRLFSRGRLVRRPMNEVWQQDLMRYLMSGTAVVVSRKDTGLSAANRRVIDDLPVIARAGGLVVHAVRR